jgi:alpha-mannosidase
MTLNPEWLHRVNRWRDELPRQFYQPLGNVPVSGFTTFDQLTQDEALKHSFTPMPVGTAWGAKWEYGWFKGELTLPEAAVGKRIALGVEVGGEGVVFVNGVAAGARDFGHSEITLTTKGKMGEKYEFVIESYGGHGETPEGGGPVAYGRQSVPEPPAAQRVMQQTTFGIWNEDAFQLWLDVETLFSLRNNLEAGSLRVAEIDKGLKEFTLMVDFEVLPDAMNKTFRAARAMLKPLLECKNGSTAPEYFAFGHAHLDVAWLWPLQETERKIARTISSQLALAAEYPEYQYLQNQTHLFMMLKQRYPEIYARVKKAIKAGNIIPEGGMWVEADTNLSSGESLIRQFMYGKAFFKQELGVDSELMWLPDVFGYSGAMPQIMKGCGINYFATAKIFWTYHGGDPFPYNLFTWEGIDGSEVLASIIYGYGNETQPGMLIQTWNGRVQNDDIATQIYAFGYGDGGGGPNRVHLEFLRRQADLEGAPRTRFASPVAFFKDAEKRGIPTARTVGELYFQNHRGTYTSQAHTKRNNRHAELALREAELWNAAAAILKGAKFPTQALHDAWQTVLLLQFHDVIPGSSIHRVYEEAEVMHAQVIESANAETLAAQRKITAKGNAVTVFNSLGWKRNALVALPEGTTMAMDSDRTPLPSQAVDGKTYVETSLPSMGWVTFATLGEPKTFKLTRGVEASTRRLENEVIRIELNRKGEITRIFDKESGQEFVSGLCNSFKMYKDVPSWFDAWDLDSMYVDSPVELDGEGSVEVVSQGELFGRLRITRKLNQSTLTQTVTLRRDSRMVEFDTKIDWQESHKLLKVAFETNLRSEEAVHEIQFGHVRRPTHASRPYDADRFEVSNHKWSALVEENRGFAVVNNAKYGLNVKDGSINLTLLKSALSPDMTADKGEQLVSYAFYIWNGSLFNSGVVQKAYELNVPARVVTGAAGEVSLFSLDAPNVVIETVKNAEDGSGDLIIRMYECMRTQTHTTLSTCLPVKSVIRTNMLEVPEEPLGCQEGKIALDFRPFEVKTLRLGMGG